MDISAIINLPELSERLGGDIGFFRDLADLYITDSAKHINAIEQSLVSGNLEALRKSAHTLKGSSLNFSAARAVAAALAVETMAKNSDTAALPQAFETLKVEIATLIDAMKELKLRDTL